MKKLLFMLVFVCICFPGFCDDPAFLGEYVFNAYYDDQINPGFKFILTKDRFYLEVPELDLSKIEDGVYINRIIDDHYSMLSRDGFNYLDVGDKRFLVLSFGNMLCVLMDCDNGDAYFGIKKQSQYITLVPNNPMRNKIGISGGMSDYQQSSSMLIETISGKKNVYNGLDEYHFQLKTPWIESSKEYGIGEWIKKRIAFKSSEIVFFNGFIDPLRPDLYTKNTRVKELLVITKSGQWQYGIEDTPNPQIIRLPEAVDGDIRFFIKDVYPGSRYKDTAIAGIYFLF